MAVHPALEDAIDTLCREALATGTLRCEPIAAGLGSRRFFRVELAAAPHRLIARCEGPDDPALRPAGVPAEPRLEPIRRELERAGLRVPRRYAASDDGRIELLEDLGDETLESAAQAAAPAERERLYAEACALVPRLQRVHGDAAAVPQFGRALDAALFEYKADQVCRWLIPETLGRPATPAERQVVLDGFGHVAAAARDAPQRLAHRDFKAQNLHRVREADGTLQLAMIDIQGAFFAPPEYDLVCLLRDLHVELAPELVARCLETTRSQLPDAPGAADLERRFELLTLSRVGKDTARFLFAARERDDPRYLQFVPTGLRYLRKAAATCAPLDPSLARLADLIAQLPEPPCAQ